MSIVFRIIIFVALVTVGSYAEAATITWSNPAGGDWATASNWNPSMVPGPADTANIKLSGTFTVTLASTAQVAALNLGGSSGTQTLANAGATLILNGASTISAHGTYAQTAGTLTVAEPLSVSGVLNWSGGTLGGTGGISIAAKGTLNISGSAPKFLLNSVDSSGEVVWSGTGDVQTGTAFNNRVGGRFTIQNDQTWSFGLGGVSSQFNNQAGAMVTKSGGSGVTTFSGGPFNNLGTVTISSGVLALPADGTSAGSFNVASGARLDFPGGTHTLVAGAAFTGGGVVGLTGPATLTLAADVAAVNLNVAGGTLDGPGGLTVTGTLQWTSGTMQGAGTTTIAAGGVLGIAGSSAKNLQRTINNAGATTWSSNGDVLCGGGVAFNNQAGGTFAIQNDQTWSFNAGGTPPQFNNLAGSTLTKDAGSGTTTFSNVPFNNNGTVHAGSGAVALAGGGAGAGLFTVAAAGSVEFSAGTYTLSSGATISGAGVARVTGTANLTLAANVMAANLELNGGSVDGAGNLTISGALNWLAGTMSGTGATTIAPGATLNLTGNLPKNLQRTVNNTGSVTWSGSGSVQSGQGAVFNNQAGGTFTSQNSQTWSFSLGGTPSQFNNQPGGTVNKIDSGTTSFSNVPFNNSGAVNVSSGVLQLAGGGVSGGPFAVASGARIEFGSATHTLQSGAAFTGAGTVSVPFPGTLTIATNVSAVHLDLNGGTLDGAGVLTVTGSLEWIDGTMTGTGATGIAPGGSFHIGGSSPKILERRVNNAGNTTWDGTGDIVSGQGAVFTNQAGGSLIIASDQTWFFNLNGTQTQFDNQTGSTLIKIAGNGVTTFSNLAFTNRGTIEATAGTLNFQPGFLQSAGITRLAGGSLLSNGIFNLQGGTLDGTGVLRGSVLNAAQVKPGTSPGKITLVGPYAQTASGSFGVELNGLAPGTEFDQLAVIGAVTVGGTLQVTLGFAPPYGATFVIIDNDGSDPVVGAFTGLPEGAKLQVGNTALSISYAGGDGNDVVLIVPAPTPTSTPTATRTPSGTSTPTPTRTPTSTTTPTRTPTQSPAPTATVTPVQTATATGSPTPTRTVTPTAVPSSTPTRSATATSTAVPSSTPTRSATATPTAIPSSTPTRSATATSTAMPSLTPTRTATATPTTMSSLTPPPTATATSTAMPSLTPTRIATATPTTMSSLTPPPTATATPTAVPSSTPTRTATGVPTVTQTQPATRTPTPSPSPTASPMATASATPTAVPSATITETPTVSPTNTATPVPASCVGDCNADGTVTIDELIVGVNLALGELPLDACPEFDVNGDGMVAVNEVIAGVDAALGSCASHFIPAVGSTGGT